MNNCACECLPGYIGDDCGEALPCLTGPRNRDCVNGGEAAGFTGKCRCDCLPGFSGNFCEIKDKCQFGKDGKQCLNSGKAAGVTGECHCDCDNTGYHGHYC